MFELKTTVGRVHANSTTAIAIICTPAESEESSSLFQYSPLYPNKPLITILRTAGTAHSSTVDSAFAPQEECDLRFLAFGRKYLEDRRPGNWTPDSLWMMDMHARCWVISRGCRSELECFNKAVCGGRSSCGVSGLVRNEILHEAVHLPCRERVFATGEQNHMLGLTLQHSTSYCETKETSSHG